MKKCFYFFLILMLCSTYILAHDLHSEVKKWKEVYDSGYYFAHNKDLQMQIGNDPKALYRHYITRGMFEGRSGSPIFNYKYYYDHNPDLHRLTPVNIVIHFIKNGMREGRPSHPKFNVKFYKNKYPQLKLQFGENNEKYYKHFLNHGYRENRQGK